MNEFFSPSFSRLYRYMAGCLSKDCLLNCVSSINNSFSDFTNYYRPHSLINLLTQSVANGNGSHFLQKQDTGPISRTKPAPSSCFFRSQMTSLQPLFPNIYTAAPMQSPCLLFPLSKAKTPLNSLVSPSPPRGR